MIGRLARRSLLPFQRAWLRTRLDRLVLEHVDGTPIVVLPGVFNPAVFRTSVPLMHALARAVTPGARVLDVGTGTGVAAIRAAERGARVTAIDVNADAVRCARINVLLNDVEERVEVRRGDLFEPAGTARFDLVSCNPPFFRGQPRDPHDRAWRSPDFIERFTAGLDGVLADGGRALVVFSSDGAQRELLAAAATRGFAVAPEPSHDLGNEVVTVYALTRRETQP